MTKDMKEAFSALCRKMAETNTKKLEFLKQQMRLLLEREGTGEGPG